MTIIFITFLIFCLITAKYKNPVTHEYHEDFLSREDTLMVNGIFVFLVFLTHFSGYVENFFKVDAIYLKFNRFLGECVVCSFLFYSGYGLTEQIKKDRLPYLHKLVTKRFFSLWLKFAICVSLFIVLAFLMGNKPTAKQILLSFVALDSVGNSAWYIFYMLCAYLILYFSFRFTQNKNVSIILLFLLTTLYTALVYILKNDSPAYYLVSFVLPVGVTFSLYKEKLVGLLEKHFILAFLVLVICYTFSFIVRHILKLGGWSYSLTAVFFTLILLCLTTKIQFQNKIIKFLGSYVFEIYILQRLPMIALRPLYIRWGGYSCIAI